MNVMRDFFYKGQKISDIKNNLAQFSNKTQRVTELAEIAREQLIKLKNDAIPVSTAYYLYT